jgi:hypothetical protein
LIPPFAFKHAKYAFIMFGPSLKSVPGCLVSIVPMLIGVPVAAWPGFGPHCDVSVDPPPLELEPPELDVEVDPPLLAAALPPALELLLLLPHAATNMAAMTAASTKPRRARSAR